MRDSIRILCTVLLRIHCVSSPQERIVIEKTDQEEATASRLVALAVEHEQHETTETNVEMPVTANTTKKCIVDSDVHDTLSTATTVTSTADRPANLGLVKQEAGLIDALHIPASPISKQVSRWNRFLGHGGFFDKEERKKLYIDIKFEFLLIDLWILSFVDSATYSI